MIVLSPEREREFVDALAEAFTPEDLDYKVADPLHVPATARSDARDVKERVAALVRWSQPDMEALIATALDGNPYSTRLRRFAESIGVLPASNDLVEAIRPALPNGDEQAWLRGLAEAQRQVCCIRVGIEQSHDARSHTTGFLVGDDQVMTMALEIADVHLSDTVDFTFEGVTIRIHRNEPVVVTANGICVLRLERSIGRELKQGTANVAVRARGWISPTRTEPAEPHSSVVIVQCAIDAVRVAVELDGLVANDGELLRYRTTTHTGSAGAPCFDAQWRLLAVHLGTEQGLNYGRSVDAIESAFRAKGYKWDASRGVYRAAMAKPPDPTGELDSEVRGVASSITETDVWSDEVDDLDLPEADRWAWIEAAAVHATFDPATLVAFGAASADARVALMLESQQVGARWRLDDRMRRAALARLAARGALASARATNPEDALDRVDVMLGAMIAGTTPKPEALRDPDALRAMLTAGDWLAGAAAGAPGRAQLRAALERATLLAPFRHLTRGFFAGRDVELAQLTAYCEHWKELPLFIHAPGGMGKSALLARFVLANAERDPMNPLAWRPFVYLDFDRPELDAMNLIGVLLAMVRQLGPQVPAIAADAQALVEQQLQRRRAPERTQRRTKRKRPNLAVQLAPDQLANVLAEVTRLFAVLPSETPIVMILDTLEEVQFANPDAIGPLVELVRRLQQSIPQLRPILAGRIPADEGVDLMELEGLPLAACEALLQNELPKPIAANTQLVARLAATVALPNQRGEPRGNPLSLRLAAEVVRREAANPERVIDELDEELQERVGDAIVQGRLYERILGHIHDARVAALAHPGLALRRITWELIRDVLAEPCGLGALDDAAAHDLFDALAKEIALVRQRPDSEALELRPELRRIVRDDLAKDPKLAEQRTKIHTAAIAFYRRGDKPADRAEEIYHRLATGEDPDEVDKRWLTGIEDFLRDAIGELPPRANAYLANRVGGVADDQQIATATPTDWEVYAAKRASDLLNFGQPQKALDLLATRTERLPASKLHYVESIARRMLPVADLAGAETAAERAVVAARVGSNSDDLRDALDELVHVRRLRHDSVGVLRGLAELGNLGNLLGDDLVLLQSNVDSLETPAPVGDREQFTQSAVRVFNRLPDELVAKAPELSRRVAAQVGASDAATLQRVIRVVGTGSLDQAASTRLHGVLMKWQHADPEIAAFVPDTSTSPREMASAVRYLAGTREIDGATATELAGWLRAVVTPKSTR